MVNLRGLIIFAIGFTLAFIAGIASASFPATPLKYATSGHFATPKGQGSTNTAACNNLLYKSGKPTQCLVGSEYGFIHQITYASEGSCNYAITYKYCSDDSATAYLSGSASYSDGGYTCPANSMLSGTTCSCNATFIESGSTCVCPSGTTLTGGQCVADCPAGQTKDANNGNTCRASCLAQKPKIYSYAVSGLTANASSWCFAVPDGKGCVYSPSIGPSWGCVGTGADQKCYYAEMSATGATCNLTSTPPPETTGGTTEAGQTPTDPPLSPEGHCIAKGQSYGYVNGAVVCVNKADSAEPTVTTQTKENADGTKTQTKTTTNADGTVTTITTTYNSSGQQISQTTTNNTGLDEFCQQNPDIQLCRTSAASGGTGCDSPPSCSGDAIQCAILEQQWRTRCDLDGTDANVQAGQDAIADGDNGNTVGTDIVDIQGQLSTQGSVSAGCLADQSFAIPVVGNFTIPWSSLCGTLEIMGWVVMAFAWAFAARIALVI